MDARVDRKPGNLPWLTLLIADSVDTGRAGLAGRIFEPLSSAESGLARGAPGIALALALSRNIIRALGGEIGYSKSVGYGSIFRVVVPAGLAEPLAAVEPTENPRALTVLVVDDNEVNLEYLRAVFEARGHRTLVASNGAEALRVLEERLVDAAVLDIQMPGMSGVELAGRIRSSAGRVADPDMPLIALTAYDPGEIERSGVRFDLVYPKPAEANRLVGSLASIVSAREAFSPVFFDTQHEHDPEGRSAALEAAQKLAARAIVALKEALSDDTRGLGALRRPVDVKVEAERFATALIRIGAPNQARAMSRFVSRFPVEERETLASVLGRIEEFWNRAVKSLEGTTS